MGIFSLSRTIAESPFHFVFVFVIADRHARMQMIAHFSQCCVPSQFACHQILFILHHRLIDQQSHFLNLIHRQRFQQIASQFVQSGNNVSWYFRWNLKFVSILDECQFEKNVNANFQLLKQNVNLIFGDDVPSSSPGNSFFFIFSPISRLHTFFILFQLSAL